MQLTRRTAILSASAASLAATAAPALAAPVPLQARIGLDSDQYQSVLNELTGQGYRLTHVDGYPVAGIPRFAAIFEQRTGPAWVTHHNLTSGQFDRTDNQLSGQGYRLRKVSGYESGGQALYAAIWVLDRAGPGVMTRLGMDFSEYWFFPATLRRKHYRLTWVSAYAVAGEPRFAAIGEAISGPWEARADLDAGALRATSHELEGKGYKLRHVSGYPVKRDLYFAAIWDQDDPPAPDARIGLTSAGFQEFFDFHSKHGWRLTDLSGYDVRGQALYAAIWNSR
jgi:hypothetical protein